MAYDVLLVAAIEDSDRATVIARRLRALKFRVRFDAGRDHTTPSSRDLGDCNKASNVLVLWSSVSSDTSRPDSDWVHAMAHLARSRDGALVQASLDETVPDEPFDKDRRFDLAGLTSRKTPEGFYRLVELIGQRDGRRDLRAWMKLPASDEAGKAAWKEAHPTDPLSHAGKRGAARKKPEGKSKAKPASVQTGAAASAAATARIADASSGHRISLNPPTPERDFYPEQAAGRSKAILIPVCLGILAMMAGAWTVRSEPLEPGGSQDGPVEIRTVAAACPAGQVPRSLVHGTLLGELESDQDGAD